MKAFIVVVVLALLGWWGYRHGYIKPEWIGLGGPAATSKGGAEESLQDTLNRGLPRMVGSDLSLDRAVANNLTVTFDFRFVDLDQYAVAQRYGGTLPPEIQNQVTRELCGVRAVREQVLARGREIQIQIRAQDNRTMYGTQLKPGGC